MSNSDGQTVLDLSPYGYIPTFSVGVIFIVVFALSTTAHVFQTVRYRMWWLLITAVLGGVGETIGWVGRAWSAKNPDLNTPFMIQICCTIIAPTPLVAVNFIILGKLVRKLGPQYSRLSPRLYAIIFCAADVSALVVQAVGGAAASAASTNAGAANGAHIMLVGIVVQLVFITFYTVLAVDFIRRYLSDRPCREVTSGASSDIELVGGGEKRVGGGHTPSKKIQMVLFGLTLSTVCIFIRAIYRTIELSDGWNGRVIHTQIYFVILDGLMIAIAMITLNVFHPGRLLQQ